MRTALRRGLLACAAAPTLTLLAGCGGGTYQKIVRPSSEAPPAPIAVDGGAVDGGAVNPPRSERGNPPFYDVLGKRYYVLATADGYDQKGIASWYGRDFHGLSTSSGETYDMHALTAAHTTLPIPTWVEVTNLANGKTVIVKVNDRGPFVGSRLIDLSYAAAKELDMIRTGTTRVEVRALGAAPVSPDGAVARVGAPAGAAPAVAGVAATGAPSASASPPPAVLPAAPGLQPQLFVQAGAFADKANAERLVERLRSSGFPNSTVVSDGTGRRALHRVRIGPLRDAYEFDQVSDRLRTVGVLDSRLVAVR
ncbi:MAG TPA: septal ring lytic transglycosylase RlpA family protein [Gammaproteobacteria bacterium]|nr:septal ring lytic transglycosylase RlpA family protein [Gammaproteobacteria bacterium]